jgi:acyl carrier protein
MNDTDFLKLLSAATKLAKPFHKEEELIADLDTQFADSMVDSLDMLMISIYLTDAFGIDEETTKTMSVTTPREMREFLLKHATKEITDVDAAIAELK